MTTVPVQRHIHLSPDIGEAPENAPDKTWITTARKEIPVAFINPRRTRKGALIPSVLLDGDGEIVQLTNWLYRIKVVADGSDSVFDRKALLKSYYGKELALVDHEHPNDGEDHDTYVKYVVCVKVSEFDSGEDRGMRFYYVDVELEDYSL